MKNITIEWRHYDKEGDTCDRCSETGQSIKNVIEKFSSEKGIQIVLTEIRLPESRMSESNLVLVNDQPIEQILPEANTTENHCSSCSCMTGKNTNCRTVEYAGKIHDNVSEEMITEAINIVLKNNS